MMEYYPNIQSWSGRLTAQSAITRWYEYYVRAMERSNRNPRIGQRLQQHMTEAGLRDVGGQIFHLPIGGWDPGMLDHRLFIPRIPVLSQIASIAIQSLCAISSF